MQAIYSEQAAFKKRIWWLADEYPGEGNEQRFYWWRIHRRNAHVL